MPQSETPSKKKNLTLRNGMCEGNGNYVRKASITSKRECRGRLFSIVSTQKI